ncbi:hypothetical protein SS50377_28195 [Spironucleus salmonicida]|uniref:Uncharacterized protein n=1 Tax=Spironucleus salmonicida TaxID=348837 RepID=A0A9P8LL57_9EUKA|nr:hypothetical protein SS50377_28195 [Spironucleus salmonicida]
MTRAQPAVPPTSRNIIELPYTNEIKQLTANYASQEYNAFINSCNIPDCKSLLKSRKSVVFPCRNDFYAMQITFIRPVHIQYLNFFSSQPFASNLRQVRMSAEGVEVGNIALNSRGGMFKVDHPDAVKSIRFEFSVFENKFHMCQIGNIGVYGNNILKMLEQNFDETLFMRQFQHAPASGADHGDFGLEFQQEKALSRNLFVRINQDLLDLTKEANELKIQLGQAMFLISVLGIAIVVLAAGVVLRAFFCHRTVGLDDVQMRARSGTLDGLRGEMLQCLQNTSFTDDPAEACKRIASCMDLQRMGKPVTPTQ